MSVYSRVRLLAPLVAARAALEAVSGVVVREPPEHVWQHVLADHPAHPAILITEFIKEAIPPSV